MSDAPGSAAPAPQPGLRSLVVRGSIGVLGLRVAAATLNFLLVLVLARVLGADAFGDYAWALSWVAILRLIVTLGYDKLVVREVAVLAPEARWGQIRGLLRRCNQAVLVVSVVALPIVIAVASAVVADGTDQLAALAVGMVALPLMSLTTMRQAAVQGLSRVALSRVPEDLAYPAAFLLVVVVIEHFDLIDLSAVSATTLRLITLGLGLLLAIVLLRRYMPREVRSAEPVYDTRRWAASSLPLVVIGGSNVFIVELGTIVVGALEGSSAAGGYAVAARITFVLFMAEFAANQALAPVIARLHASGQRDRLQAGLTKGARAVFVTSAVAGVLITVLAPQLLAIFGDGYTDAVGELRALVVSWLANLAFGFCGLVLIMTGRERDAAVGLLAGAVACLPLSIGLTVLFGPVGAASATGISMVVWNVVLTRRVWTARRLDTTILGMGGSGRGS